MSCNCALILAAGKGERLKPITNEIPKPLIRAGRYRLIEYHIINLAKAGVNRIYINRAHLRHKFDELLDLQQFPDVEISYLDEPRGALETAGAIINAFNKIHAGRLIVVNGDIWTNFNFNNINNLPCNINDNAHVILTANPNHNRGGDFSLDGNRLIERQDNRPSYTFTGIGIYRRQMFEMRSVEFLRLAPMLRQQVKLNKVSASLCTKKWMDVGTLERLSELRMLLRQDPAYDLNAEHGHNQKG